METHQREQEREETGLLRDSEPHEIELWTQSIGDNAQDEETSGDKERIPYTKKPETETSSGGNRQEEEYHHHEDASLKAILTLCRNSPEVMKHEIRVWWQLAWPLSIIIAARFSLIVTDVAILGHLGTDYLAASSLANLWIMTTSTFFILSLRSAVSTLASQAVGGDNYRLANVWLIIGLYFSLAISVIFAILWGFGTPALALLGTDNKRIVELATTFCRLNILGAFPTIAYAIMDAWLIARKTVYPLLVVNLFLVVFNLLSNLVLVHGIGGVSGLGFIGSPIATALSRWLALLLITQYCRYKRMFSTSWPGLSPRNVFTKSRLKEFTCKQWLPLMVGIAMEEFQLQVVGLMAAKLSAIALATHLTMFDMFYFLTSTLYGLLNATRTRVGHNIGSMSIKMAKAVALVDFVISLAIGSVNATLLIIFHDVVGRIFTSDERVLEKISVIAFTLAPGYLILSIFYVIMATLTGLGYPRPVAVAFIIGAWCTSVPLGYILAYHSHMGILGLWVGLVCGYSVIAIVSGVYLLCFTNWHKAVENNRLRNADNGGS